MSTQAAAPAQPYQRKLKNFLLDARFQLKFAVYFIVPTLVISGVLGFFIFSTTGNLFRQMSQAVEARSKSAETSKELGTCTLNNELTKGMDDPALMSKLEVRSKEIDAAYEAEKQAKHHHRQSLDDGAMRQRDGRYEADDHQRAIFGGTELQRNCGQGWRKQSNQNCSDRSGKERTDGGSCKRHAGAALARHLITVDCSDGRRGFAWHVDENGGRGAAILRAVIDAGEHDQ